MANNKILYIVIAILVLIIVGGGIFVLGFLGHNGATGGSNNGQPLTAASSSVAQTSTTSAADTQMVDCGAMKDPTCFFNRLNGCLPVKAELTGTDGSKIEISILGVENNTCHFQRKINDAVNLNCFFPKGTLTWDAIDQTFGNDKGLQKVVDAACQTGW